VNLALKSLVGAGFTLRPPRLDVGKVVQSEAILLQASVQLFREKVMGRGLILWLIGIPLPVILVLYFLGYLS